MPENPQDIVGLVNELFVYESMVRRDKPEANFYLQKHAQGFVLEIYSHCPSTSTIHEKMAYRGLVDLLSRQKLRLMFEPKCLEDFQDPSSTTI